VVVADSLISALSVTIVNYGYVLNSVCQYNCNSGKRCGILDEFFLLTKSLSFIWVYSDDCPFFSF
jgi:hypothetical protein